MKEGNEKKEEFICELAQNENKELREAGREGNFVVKAGHPVFFALRLHLTQIIAHSLKILVLQTIHCSFWTKECNEPDVLGSIKVDIHLTLCYLLPHFQWHTNTQINSL